MHDDTNTSILVPGLINTARPVLQLTPASGGGRPVTGVQCGHTRADTNRLIVNWNGWSRNILKMALHCVSHSFFKKWNLTLCDRIGSVFSWMLWFASKPCDVEITWLHCQYLVVCVCEVNCIIALILWINNLQKMENIRQTFTDASSLLSKAVKVTINKSNCWIRLIITHHRTQIFKMRPPWSSIVQSRYLENFSHVLAPQLGHEFDVW